ncbi:GTP-binding protein [Demequina sp. NBRC 110055]|uniref:GTP-binding protein n=1 Tax=Demequina sp. NBRC 110055 TaxID=1570344 RepID=UPI000A0551FE|nr:GTP-binding protein [Demequina sp. NBRC 110055]
MSIQFEAIGQPDEAEALRQRVARLRSSMEWASDAIPQSVRAEVTATIERCDERLALGVEHTVVALAGGTGSGKSTLFNAILGREFAVAGVARPTTSAVSAAVWGGRGDALLDWLGVDRQRRLARSIDQLDDPDEDQLRGMVLLDLPDHDSVNPENRAVVDRVVPMADLLLWVVDPQKYADHALHSAYLETASRHGSPSLVVLNHVDRLTTKDAWAVARDLQRLLAVDGMTQVPVMPVSAKTGHGMDILRAELAGAVAARSVAAEAVRADLVSAGRALAGALSKGADPQLPDAEELVIALARAAGVDARAESAAAVARGASAGERAPMRLSIATVERERLDWVDAATDGLPAQWRRVVAESVLDAPSLAARIEEALADAAWPSVDPPQGWRALFAKATLASAARKKTLEAGRAAVRAVIAPEVVEPTETIHQAYRALDELTELEAGAGEEQS